ncbi:MAG: non-homologous end-joining DNA ligase [Planctomycetota bacterium]
MTRREIDSHHFETSNEDKLLFPDVGITKGEVIEYTERIAEHALPWLTGRPLTLQRFPDGISKDGFYQKQASAHFPDWIRRVEIEKVEGGRQELVVADSAASLAYLANQGTISWHPWLSKESSPHRPDQMIIDLDPADEDFGAVREAARACRRLLDELELEALIKTTGSRGVHLLIPLDGKSDFDTVRAFARDCMDVLARRHPETLTTEIRKDERRGRLFLDVARNAYGQTAVAPYSLRALPGAPIATPIDWDELGSLEARSFHLKNIFRRLGQREDPWARAPKAVALKSARARLEELDE